MIKLIERTSDRLLGMMVPKVTAKADPCACSVPGSYYKGTLCFCFDGLRYYHRQTCDGCQYGPSTCETAPWYEHC